MTMTPERRAELQRLVAAWRSPDPMRQEDAVELPSAAAELLAEVQRLEAVAKDFASLDATVVDLKARIADWDDKAASLDGDLGSIERRQLGLLEQADELIAAGGARIAALESQIAEAAADLAVREEAHAAFVSAQSEQLTEAEDHTAEQIAAWLVRWTSRGEVATRAAAAGIAGFIRSGKWRLS